MAAAKEGCFRQWMLLSRRVGSRCLSTLLGLGYNRLHAVCHGQVDLRFKAFGFASCFQSPYLRWKIMLEV